MEINGAGCYATQTNQFPSGGKLQNVSPEEHRDEAQQNALTQQTGTMQHSPSSVPDDYKPISQRARNSVDSGVGRSSSTEDTDELASSIAQCIPAHESCESTTHVPSTGTNASHLEGLLTKMAMKIDQSLSEFGTSLRKLELQVQMLQREVSSLKRSLEISESTPNKPFCTSACSDSPETEPTPTVDSQSVYTRTMRLYSDSKIASDRKFEIKKNQMESAKKRPLSEIVHVSSDVHAITHVLVNKYLVVNDKVNLYSISHNLITLLAILMNIIVKMFLVFTIT